MQASKWVSLGVLSAATLMAPLSGHGQATRIGVIDTNLIITESVAGQAAFAALEEYDAQRVQVLVDLDAEITRKTGEYEAQAPALSTQGRADREREIQALGTRFQREQEDYVADMQVRQQELLDPVFALALEKVEELRAAEGYMLILDPNVVEGLLVAVDPSADVSMAVIERMNSTSPAP